MAYDALFYTTNELQFSKTNLDAAEAPKVGLMSKRNTGLNAKRAMTAETDLREEKKHMGTWLANFHIAPNTFQAPSFLRLRLLPFLLYSKDE